MKELSILLASALALALPLGSARLNSLVVQVPFAFEMSGTVLPPGEYDFALDPGGTVLVQPVVRSTGPSAMALSNPIDMSRSAPVTMVIFNKYGDRYFLSQVRHPAQSCLLLKSRQEREWVSSRLVASLTPVPVVIYGRVW